MLIIKHLHCEVKNNCIYFNYLLHNQNKAVHLSNNHSLINHLIMTTSKNYDGKIFLLKIVRGQYRVTAIGIDFFWYQTTQSVREANRISKLY